MRLPCLDCVRKHLAQALVLMHEVKKGYPEHYWLVIGHMAEAEDEMLGYNEEYANMMRNERVRYMLNKNYRVPIMKMIQEVGEMTCSSSSQIEAQVQEDDLSITITLDAESESGSAQNSEEELYKKLT